MINAANYHPPCYYVPSFYHVQVIIMSVSGTISSSHGVAFETHKWKGMKEKEEREKEERELKEKGCERGIRIWIT